MQQRVFRSTLFASVLLVCHFLTSSAEHDCSKSSRNGPVMFSAEKGEADNNFVIVQCGDKAPYVNMTQDMLAKAPADIPLADMTASVNAACEFSAVATNRAQH